MDVITVTTRCNDCDRETAHAIIKPITDLFEYTSNCLTCGKKLVLKPERVKKED